MPSDQPTDHRTWVLDTHVWIRLLSGDREFNIPRFLSELDAKADQGGLRLAAVSIWEAAMLAAKGRLKLAAPVEEWITRALAMPGLALVPLSPRVAVDSSFLPGQFHGDPADRQIVATARDCGGLLITLDQAILDYSRDGWVHARSPREWS